ncbi:hypothetical protein OS493_010784 [Desmophyllum pertusum]|uniref:Uncharacterized protein n=1 Tax=Desmophyllum pertusum TaxID=174260 RepID=A0A9W9ZEI3_9CNID|nr:hypothetical protein OS493_010784 [Desmophyllum pertusum]
MSRVSGDSNGGGLCDSCGFLLMALGMVGLVLLDRSDSLDSRPALDCAGLEFLGIQEFAPLALLLRYIGWIAPGYLDPWIQRARWDSPNASPWIASGFLGGFGDGLDLTWISPALDLDSWPGIRTANLDLDALWSLWDLECCILASGLVDSALTLRLAWIFLVLDRSLWIGSIRLDPA